MTKLRNKQAYNFSKSIAVEEATILVGKTEYVLMGSVIAQMVGSQNPKAVYQRLRKVQLGRPLSIGNQLLYPKKKVVEAVTKILATMAEQQEVKNTLTPAEQLLKKLDEQPELAKILLELMAD